MIWLQTLILLIIAVLLTRLALAEKRHYLENSQTDDKLSEDEGLIMTLSKRFHPDSAALAESSSLFAKTVAHTHKRLTAPDNPLDQRVQRSLIPTDSNTIIDKATRSAQRLSSAIDNTVERRIQKQAQAPMADANRPLTDDTWFSRVARRVQHSGERFDTRSTQQSAPSTDVNAPLRSGVFGKSVGKIAARQQNDADLFSRCVQRVRQRIDQVDSTRSAPEEDLITRTAHRFGHRKSA